MTLPDFLKEETEDVIFQRMLARVPDNLDKNEASYLYDALAAAALEIVQMKVDMNNFLGRVFVSESFGEYLDKRCEEKGLTRRAANIASGQVTFSGTNGTVISSGTIVMTEADAVLNISSVEFETVGEVTIGETETGEVNANVQAVVAGVEGNVSAQAICLLPTPIDGVTSVNNVSSTTGGSDEEDDDSLRQRYLIRVQKPGTSGNKANYYEWATDVDGVGGAQVISQWNGTGTVKVVLIDTEYGPANSELVDTVQQEIDPTSGAGDGEAPICAEVTVVAASGMDIDISATVTLDGTKTIDKVSAMFSDLVNEYLVQLAKEQYNNLEGFSGQGTVRYVRIGSFLLDTEGVQDYSSLTVNSGTSNIIISTGEVAQVGTVTLNAG